MPMVVIIRSLRGQLVLVLVPVMIFMYTGMVMVVLQAIFAVISVYSWTTLRLYSTIIAGGEAHEPRRR